MRFVEYFDLVILLFFSLIWSGICAFLKWKKKKQWMYVLFFTVFYIYIIKVLDYTLFQFQSLLLLKYFVPDLSLRGQAVGEEINLIPFFTLTSEDWKTSLLNILLFVPFGFGLPFITNSYMKKIVMIGALLSVVIELLQLITGLLAKVTFRIADINDVIFNTLGAAVGYILFIGFMRIYLYISRQWNIPANPILQYIAQRPQR